MKNLKLKISGFTLVELLIVVAVIGVLAAALLMSINPIEQINKARDGGALNRCKEFIGARERWYAITNDDAPCATLVSNNELKGSFNCADLTAGGSAGVYTCTFTPASRAYNTQCAGDCTIPDDFRVR